MAEAPAGADIVVIGGGLVGTSLAYDLVDAGAETLLIDRRDPGRATDAGAGILSPETSLDPDPALFALGLAAARHYPALVDRLGADGALESGYSVTGSVLVAERPGDDAVMEAAAGLAATRCPEIVTEIDAAAVASLFPPLGPVRRALHNPAGRRVDGRVLNQAIGQCAASRGLRRLETSVVGLETSSGGDTVERVRTAAGTLRAGAMVVAGGAWSEQMADLLGVPLPVAPLKGQIVHLVLPGTDSRHWCIVQPVLSFYLVPWPGGRVACGGTMESGAGFDHRPTAEGVHQLLRECLRTAPGLGPATLTDIRVGLRPATPDGRPVLGRLPGWTNVFVATGHGAEGLLLGPYTAGLVAACVLGQETAGDALELCAPGRFRVDRQG